MSKANPNPLKFDSTKIKAPKIKYFIRIKKAFPLAKFLNAPKTPIVLTLVILFIFTIITGLAIFLYHRNQDPQTSDQSETFSANNVYEKALETADSSSPTAFFEALIIFDDAIEKQTDSIQQNEIKLLKANFYIDYKFYNEAIDILLELENSKLSDFSHANALLKLSQAYYLSGDTESSEIWATKYNNSYPGEE